MAMPSLPITNAFSMAIAPHSTGRRGGLGSSGRCCRRATRHSSAGVTPTTKPVIAEPTAADTAPAASPGPITITVLPGFTLWAIAKKNLGNGVMYVQVFEANKDKIKDPDLIYPGQVFTVPASP